MGKTANRISLQAEGISCAGCATDAETVLCNTDGILNVTVNYGRGVIDIEYEPDEIKEDQVLAAVKKMGFKIRLL